MTDPWSYCFDRRDVSGGNQISLLIDGRQAFSSMLEAIRSAKKFVCLETYIFSADSVGLRFTDALETAAQRGVRCALLYDAMGSHSLPEQLPEGLRASGVAVAAFRPLSTRIPFQRLVHRDHRKVLVVDGDIAFVGGMNLHREAAMVEDGGEGWHDFAVRVEGPAVLQLLELFRDTWEMSRAPALAIQASSTKPSSNGDAIRVVAADRLRGRWAIRRAFLYATSVAQRSVRVASGYFFPDAGTLRALDTAAARGVNVSVLVSEHSDIALADLARDSLYDRILKTDIRLYQWTQSVLHAKVAVVDDVWAMIGSYNFDRLSLFRNQEVVVNVIGGTLPRALGEALDRDMEQSSRVRTEDWQRRTWARRQVERVAYHLLRRL